MKSSDKNSKNQKTRCQSHKKSKDLGYVQWHIDAEKRTLKGEQQIFCKSCERWIWSNLYNNKITTNNDN
jgi:hypothetical protein